MPASVAPSPEPAPPAAPSRPPPPPAASSTRAFAAVALVLALLVPATWAVEAARVAAITSDAEAPAAARAETIGRVQAAATALFAEMQREGDAVAALPAVRRALADTTATGVDGAALDALVARGPPPQGAIEVVRPGRSLVAWTGLTISSRLRRAPDGPRTRVVADGAGRRAFEAWTPVQDADGALLGAVRVVRLAQAAVPVRNEYLEDYDVADAWRESVGRPFTLVLRSAPPAADAVPLRGPGGERLGWIRAPEPSVRALAAEVREQTRSTMAFWALLLLGWLTAGLAGDVARQLRRAARVGRRGAWARSALAVGALAAVLGGIRYSLLVLDVPVRWLGSGRETVPLFDPALLASALGRGLLRSPGDLALTAALGVALAAAGLAFALRYAGARTPAPPRPGRLAAAVLAVVLVAAAAAAGLALLGRSAVLDSTLGYADRTGPVLDGLLLVVLGGLVALAGSAAAAVAAAALVARTAAWPSAAHDRAAWLALTAAAGLAGALGGGAVGDARVALAGAALGGLGVALAALLDGRSERWTWPLTFRGGLVGAFALAPVLYGVLAGPLRDRTDADLAFAAGAFAGGRDSRVTYALDQVLAEARSDDALRPTLLRALGLADSLQRQAAAVPDSLLRDSLAAGLGGAIDPALDSTRESLGALAEGLVQSSLLGSLADVAAELRFVSPGGATLGAFAEGGAAPARGDALGFEAARAAYRERGETGSLILSAATDAGRPRYAGLGPLGRRDAADEPAAWVYVRARPRPSRFAAETPFPRVLAPADLFGLDDEAVAYAEYAGGVLARSQGGSAPLRLPEAVADTLAAGAGSVWRTERSAAGTVRAYYGRLGSADGADGVADVVSARLPAGDGADALLVLLRLTLSGLVVGAALFLVGVPLRRRAGLLPPPRTRFRDKVLNRFLAVGLASVALTGLVGQQVLREQNRQSVRESLRARLARAEAQLAADAAPGVATGTLLDRARPDALSASLGFDVHLYDGADLLASSRRQLVRQRLIEPRLPAEVVHRLYILGEPVAYASDRVGTGRGGFAYTTGYKALPDSAGRPTGAIAVPTLPEQAAIEAGQARMVTYLFGGLLALLVAIGAGAALLAGQLTRPFGRLQRGLQAVGEGSIEEPIPVETRDEVGALVETFNAMQGQLAESRRRLAEQERELAWREMAKQVAHEIKNPLTPMKLSVQHLRHTFRPPGPDAPPPDLRFAGAFERTTEMLVEQIEGLRRIASEFSDFARLPLRHPEPLDLGAVAGEAAALFEAESLAADARAVFRADLAPQPLPVVADREELRRAFVNLLTNALQAMPPPADRPGGAPGSITVRTRAAEAPDGTAWAVAEVADTGTGVAPEAREKIFQPSFSTKSSGMGLGLAVVKRAVEAAGGTVAFETVAEGAATGTTFTLRLPLAAPDAEREGEASGAG